MVRSQITLGCLVAVLLGGFAALIPAEEMTRIVVSGESRSTGSKIEEARQRIAEKKWSEAIGLLQAVIEVGEQRSRGDQSRSQCRGSSSRPCRSGISGPECLRLYRKRIEAQAKRWLEAASAGENRAYLRLVEEAFCSVEALTCARSSGRSGVSAGRFAEAEIWWQLAAPLQQSVRKDTPPDVLVYPDPPPALVARLQAKQLLARLFRDAPHWQEQVAAYRKVHPKAAGGLTGRKGLYADILIECAKEREKLHRWRKRAIGGHLAAIRRMARSFPVTSDCPITWPSFAEVVRHGVSIWANASCCVRRCLSCPTRPR